MCGARVQAPLQFRHLILQGALQRGAGCVGVVWVPVRSWLVVLGGGGASKTKGRSPGHSCWMGVLRWFPLCTCPTCLLPCPPTQLSMHHTKRTYGPLLPTPAGHCGGDGFKHAAERQRRDGHQR